MCIVELMQWSDCKYINGIETCNNKVSLTCSWSPAVCFEAGPSRGMSTVAEEAGMACVNVTRSFGDPDTFGYRAVAGTAGGALR